jgi:hypothetical protein
METRLTMSTKELKRLKVVELIEAKHMTVAAGAAALHGIMLAQQGDCAGAAQVLQEALALSRRIGETTMIFFCLDRLAINAIVHGELVAAVGYADQLLDSTEPGMPPPADIRISCGPIYLGAGRIAEALVGRLAR